jgi:CrcB protein
MAVESAETVALHRAANDSYGRVGAVGDLGPTNTAPLERREAMERFFWVCFGSALGGGARYLVSGWALRVLGPAFPYGTLAVNVIGSFLLGGLMFVGTETAALSPTLRIALTTGVMGGFTTYSTFSYETMRYVQDGAWGTAVTNVLITVIVCLLATVLGWTGARWLFGP